LVRNLFVQPMAFEVSAHPTHMCSVSDLFMSGVLPASQEACTVAQLRVQHTLSALHNIFPKA